MVKVAEAGKGAGRGRAVRPTQRSHPQPSANEAGQRPGQAAGFRKSGESAPIKASLEFALLGLIAESRAVSGYDLVKAFDASMVHYWHAHHGQIYPTLDRLRVGGLVASRDVIQHRRPNKRLYSITNAGRAALLKWLLSPAEPFKIKHAPLLRTRFLGHLGPEAACAKLREDRAICGRLLATYRGFERRFRREGDYRDANEMFSYFTLRYGIVFTEQSIAFCNWAVEEITRNRGLFSHRRKRLASKSDRSGECCDEKPKRQITADAQSGEASRILRIGK